MKGGSTFIRTALLVNDFSKKNRCKNYWNLLREIIKAKNYHFIKHKALTDFLLKKDAKTVLWQINQKCNGGNEYTKELKEYAFGN